MKTPRTGFDGVHTALVVEELPPPRSLPALVSTLARDAYPWLLESSLVTPPRGRYSFVGADPYVVFRSFGRRSELEVRRAVHPELPIGWRSVAGHPLEVLRWLLPARPPDANHPIPFCGGAVGVFGYALGGLLESLPAPPSDDLGLPDLALLFVDRVLAFDHLDRRLFACALGFDRDPVLAAGCARCIALELRDRFEPICDSAPESEERTELERPSLMELDARASSLPLEGSFDAAEYAKAVGQILEEIGAGNVYQACLTQRLELPWSGDPFALHRRLRCINPAPFAACLTLPGATLVSSSPERFLKVSGDGWAESRPIKGTRPRGRDDSEDRALQRALAASEKDRAENLMIVDLVRNDLGRVCEIGSVHVPDLMAVESYATLFQMVSTVRGRLRSDCDAIDCLAACFPPGSMTGAPKIAAMELLTRLERCRRGFYSGALGYLDVRGGLDLSVLIRAVLLRRGRAYLHVGGGVVADSNPEGEYRESMDKARALLAALADENRPRTPADRRWDLAAAPPER